MGVMFDPGVKQSMTNIFWLRKKNRLGKRLVVYMNYEAKAPLWLFYGLDTNLRDGVLWIPCVTNGTQVTCGFTWILTYL